MTDFTFVFQSLKGLCRGNQFWGKISEIGLPHLHFLHWHLETIGVRDEGQGGHFTPKFGRKGIFRANIM